MPWTRTVPPPWAASPAPGRRGLPFSRGRCASLLGFCAFELAYICAYHYGMSFDPVVAAPFWFPDAVLLCGLLCTRPKWWWVLLAAILPVRLLVAAPFDLQLWFLAAVYVNDCAKGVLAALLLRRFLEDPIRLQSMRDLGIYFLFAVLLVPALSALGGAADARRPGQSFLAELRTVVARRCAGQPRGHSDPFLLGVAAAESGHLQPAANHRSGTARHRLAHQPEIRLRTRGRARATLPRRGSMRQCPSWSGRRSASACSAPPRSRPCCRCSPWTRPSMARARSPTLLRGDVQPSAALPVVAHRAAVSRGRAHRAMGARQQFAARQRAAFPEHRGLRAGHDVDLAAPMAVRTSPIEGGWISPAERSNNRWEQGGRTTFIRTTCSGPSTNTSAASASGGCWSSSSGCAAHDGEYRWIMSRGAPRYGADGEFMGYVGSAIDLTDRRQQEAALKRSESRYRDVVESQANFVCRLLPDGTLTFINSAYCRFLGRERLDLLGESFVGLLPPLARGAAAEASEARAREHRASELGVRGGSCRRHAGLAALGVPRSSTRRRRSRASCRPSATTSPTANAPRNPDGSWRMPRASRRSASSRPWWRMKSISRCAPSSATRKPPRSCSRAKIRRWRKSARFSPTSARDDLRADSAIRNIRCCCIAGNSSPARYVSTTSSRTC